MGPTQVIAATFARIPVALHRPATWSRLALALGLVYVGIVLATFRDYGITYDEHWHATYGEYVVKWFASGFKDTSALTFFNPASVGGSFDALYWLAGIVSPVDVFESRHLLIAVTGVVVVTYAFKVGSELAGPYVGFLAALFLVLTPRFYGHSFNNPIDVPVASLAFASLYYLIKLIDKLPTPQMGLIVKLALATGLALGIRVGLVLIVGYTALAFTLWFVLHVWHPLKNGGGHLRTLTILLMTFGLICVLAYGVMLFWWPSAQVTPITYPARALWHSLHTLQFSTPFTVYFEGHNIPNSQLPMHYVLEWCLISLPEFLIFALAIGFSLGLAALFRARAISGWTNDPKFLGFVMVIVYSATPLLLATITHPTDYDEVRHFIFILPGLSVIAALSFVKLLQILRSSLARVLISAAMFVSMTVTASDMAQLHPDEYIYFNRLFGGGVAQASKSFETDYWGNGYKEAVQWLSDNVASPVDGKRLKVASCLYSLSTSYYLPVERFDYVGSLDDGQPVSGVPDLFLASPRWGCDHKLAGTVIHTVTRMGAPLITIVRVAAAPQGANAPAQQLLSGVSPNN